MFDLSSIYLLTLYTLAAGALASLYRGTGSYEHSLLANAIQTSQKKNAHLSLLFSLPTYHMSGTDITPYIKMGLS